MTETNNERPGDSEQTTDQADHEAEPLEEAIADAKDEIADAKDEGMSAERVAKLEERLAALEAKEKPAAAAASETVAETEVEAEAPVITPKRTHWYHKSPRWL